MTSFVAAAPQAKWAVWSAIFLHTMGSVKLTGGVAEAAPTPTPTPGTTPTPTPGTMNAWLYNQSSENIHIYLAGGSCDPSNRVMPGQIRVVPVKMGADGRITFQAGRNGQTLLTKTWTGNPKSPDYWPRVFFTADGLLEVATGLR